MQLATFTENRGQCVYAGIDVKCVVIFVLPRGKHRGQTLPHTFLLWASRPLLVPPTLIPSLPSTMSQLNLELLHQGRGNNSALTGSATHSQPLPNSVPAVTAGWGESSLQGFMQHISEVWIKAQALSHVILPSQQCWFSQGGLSRQGLTACLSSLNQSCQGCDIPKRTCVAFLHRKMAEEEGGRDFGVFAHWKPPGFFFPARVLTKG